MAAAFDWRHHCYMADMGDMFRQLGHTDRPWAFRPYIDRCEEHMITISQMYQIMLSCRGVLHLAVVCTC